MIRTKTTDKMDAVNFLHTKNGEIFSLIEEVEQQFPGELGFAIMRLTEVSNEFHKKITQIYNGEKKKEESQDFSSFSEG